MRQLNQAEIIMVTHTQVSPHSEPTPEFNERCMALITGWRQGEIATEAVTQQLKALAREAEKEGHAANQGRAEHLSGYIQHYLGNYTISNNHYEAARRLFQRVGNRQRIATMDMNMGENYRYRGEFKRAQLLYRNAFAAANELNDLRIMTISISNEGLTLISTGNFADARHALEQGLALSEQWGEDQQKEALSTEIHYGLAQVDLALNNSASAWNHAYRALNHANNSANLHSVGLAYRILGDAMTALGQPQEGAIFNNPDDYYRAALETFKEIDAEAEIARTVFQHARSLAKRGRRRNAAQLLRDAMVIFTKLGMTDDAAHAADEQLRVL
jgi:tetratricopeptide (TPR) repeat protein